MARLHHLPPSAAALSESMRDLGYSLETAVADIVDNSISAEATNIDILCDLTQQNPTLVVVDDGKGMSEDEIVAAMRHGSVNPGATRGPYDLGRFGLGLKTASFSQCRSLTVASAQNGNRSAAEWDLDLVNEKDDWMISILDEEDILSLPFIDRLGEKGTIVIWRTLDRLFEDEDGARRDEIVNEKLDLVERHLSLVFHRFLAGELKGRKKIAISINGHPVEPFDPFCRKSGAQLLPEDVVRVGGETIRIQPYILPHHSRLSAKDYDFYQNRSGRLMAWGDWFRLIPKGEATKLARVQIDFPNSLDEAWTIDIKKSRARPPRAVRERLRQIIPQISGRGVRVHRGRGEKLFDEIEAPLWDRYADREGIRFAVNLEHPLVRSLLNRLDEEGARNLRLLMSSIGSSLPVEMIYSDYSTQPRAVKQADESASDIEARLRELRILLFGDQHPNPKEFRDLVRSTRLFEHANDAVEKYIREELQ